jgi:hypothetical protein
MRTVILILIACLTIGCGANGSGLDAEKQVPLVPTAPAGVDLSAPGEDVRVIPADGPVSGAPAAQP